MTKVEMFVQSLGIPKEHKCSACSKITRFDISERHNMAVCMVINSAGIWCLTECKHCGYIEQLYPERINGIDCTKDECEKLFKEIMSFPIQEV